MMRDDDDTMAFWMGYMLGTVKDCARRTHDKSCIDSLRVFVKTSQLVQLSDIEALNKIDSGDDPLYQGNRDDAEKSAGLEAQDLLYEAARKAGYTDTAAHNIAGFFRRVPDTPGLRLAGVFECEPDPSCGARDGAA